MRRARFARLGLWASLGVSALQGIECVGADPNPSPAGATTDAAADGREEAPDSTAEACTPKVYSTSDFDQEGCPCMIGSPSAACHRGLGGIKSACTPGTQSCGPTGRWGPCMDAGTPDAELCGNDRDDDCNGDVDEVCDAGIDAEAG